MVKYIITAFKVSEEKTVYYRKCEDIEELKRALWYVLERKNVDFVTIRRVRSVETEEYGDTYELK